MEDDRETGPSWFAAVPMAVGVPAAVLDLEGRHVSVNDGYCELLGWPAERLEGRHFAEVTDRRDVEACVRSVGAMAAGDLEWSNMTKRYVRRTGDPVWCSVSKTVLRDPSTSRPVAVLSTVLEADSVAAEALRLREAEERFRLSFEHAPIGMALVGLDGTWLSVNRELVRILGRDETALRELRFQDVTHPDDLESDVALLRDLLVGRIDSYRLEKRYVRPDGSGVWAELIATLVRRTDGEPLHFLGHITDLTERRIWEESLREQEQRLRTLADDSNDFFVCRLRVHPELTFEYLSEAVSAISGYEVDELRADPGMMFDLVHPDDAHALADRLANPAASRHGTYRFRHRDGHDIWLKIRHIPIMVEDQMVAIDAIATDVTDQKQTEEALAAQERWFSSLIQDSTEVVVVTDSSGSIRHASPSVERLLGWATDDVVGQDIWSFFHPDQMADLREQVVDPRCYRNGIRLRVRTKAGGWHWLEATFKVVVDDPVIDGIVINARDITAQAAAESALQKQAVTDELTGLPNRTLLEDRISRAIGRHDDEPTMVAVLAVNLDRFRTVNEIFGQHAADELLVAVGARLAAIVARTQTVARFAADEFVICAEGYTAVGQVFDLAETVRAALARPFTVAGEQVTLSASVGVAVVDRPGTPGSEAITRAGLALREAKCSGGDRVLIFDPELRSRAQERRGVENGLRAALSKGGLVLHYQPIVGLHDDQPVGVEALLRWQHPDRGLVSPDEFVPVAEETGLICPIGDWVVEQACRQIAEWRQSVGLDHLTVSVNVAARQLDDPTFVDRVQHVLEGNDLPPASLTIEVTESTVISGAHVTQLQRISQLGVTVALDDFGTHYSSLAHIQRLPVQQIKIDRSFVDGVTTDPGRRAIIMAVAQLARGLRLTTIAEGVETPGQAADLALLGIDRAQGYLYSRPTAADRLPSALGAGAAPRWG